MCNCKRNIKSSSKVVVKKRQSVVTAQPNGKRIARKIK